MGNLVFTQGLPIFYAICDEIFHTTFPTLNGLSTKKNLGKPKFSGENRIHLALGELGSTTGGLQTVLLISLR